MQNYTQKLKQAGRNGDSQLVHMRPDEVRGLGLLAQATGNPMTTNPKTGYPEAWSLPSWVLPAAAIAATVMTGGAAAPVAAGALGGGAAAGAAGGAALGAGAAGTGLLAAEGAAAGGSLLGATPVAEGAAGLLGTTQAAAPVVDLSSSAGLLDKANFATGNMASTGGLLDKAGGYLDTANKVAKPIQTGMQVANMFTPPPKPEIPIPVTPMAQPQTYGPQALSQLAGQNQQNDMLQQQSDMMKREQRKQMIARIGGGY